LLDSESDTRSFRVLWVAGIALARAVGHVLHKVDAQQSPALAEAVAAAFEAWKADRDDNAIFWDFIEAERNQVLKQYEVGFLEGPTSLTAAGQIYDLDGSLFCPIVDGPFAGEDCRDLLEQAISWWASQLECIQVDAQRRARLTSGST